MKKYINIFIWLSVLLFGCSYNTAVEVTNQEKDISYYRHPDQIYLEDSADVFWTHYPDPFSPPTYRDRYVIGQAFFLKCFLPGKVEIGFIDTKNGNVISKVAQPDTSVKKSNENFWIWFAENTVDTLELPQGYFKSQSDSPLNLALIVDNKIKSILPIKLKVPPDMFCFINWFNHFKKKSKNHG